MISDCYLKNHISYEVSLAVKSYKLFHGNPILSDYKNFWFLDFLDLNKYNTGDYPTFSEMLRYGEGVKRASLWFYTEDLRFSYLYFQTIFNKDNYKQGWLWLWINLCKSRNNIQHGFM